MDRGVFFALVNFAAVLLVAVLLFTLLAPFIPALVWGGVLAFAFFPVHRRLLSWARGRVNLASLFSTVLVVVLVVVPMALAGVALARQSATLMETVQTAVHEGKIPDSAHVLVHPMVADALRRAEPFLMGADPKEALLEVTKGLSGAAINLSTRVFKNAVAFLFQFAIMVFVIFFAFKKGEEATCHFWSVVPLAQRDKEVLQDVLKRVVEAVLYGVVMACLVQGILGGVGFALIGLPSPVFFGALMALCAFVPVIGTAIVWVPAALYLLAAGRYGAALFMAIWGGIVVSGVDNVFRPLFISGRARISLFVVALGVIGGLITFGFLGVIVGPLLFALSLELFRIYREDIFPGREKAAECTPGDPAGGGGA